jgi:hypothetical protein
MDRPVSVGVYYFPQYHEWTEGSYLEPDETTGMAYLEAIATATR